MNQARPDRLSALLSRFRVEAHILSTGFWSAKDKDSAQPNLFIFPHGHDADTHYGREIAGGDDPVLVFYPRGLPIDQSMPDPSCPNAPVMAVIHMGGDRNPFTRALPEQVILPLEKAQAVYAVAELLMEEGRNHRCGGQAVIDRLGEVMVIRLLRQLIEDGNAKIGLLAGLSDPGLARAIVAMHEKPAQSWTLERLADEAAMSRTTFANSFHKIVGVTPGAYLGEWRLTLARLELERGSGLKKAASLTGFSGPPALSRAYKRHFGHAPSRLS